MGSDHRRPSGALRPASGPSELKVTQASGHCYETRRFTSGRPCDGLGHHDAPITPVAECIDLGAVPAEPEMLYRVQIGRRLPIVSVSRKPKELSVPMIKWFCTGGIRALRQHRGTSFLSRGPVRTVRKRISHAYQQWLRKIPSQAACSQVCVLWPSASLQQSFRFLPESPIGTSYRLSLPRRSGECGGTESWPFGGPEARTP